MRESGPQKQASGYSPKAGRAGFSVRQCGVSKIIDPLTTSLKINILSLMNISNFYIVSKVELEYC
jgi:hypothetical protein